MHCLVYWARTRVQGHCYHSATRQSTELEEDVQLLWAWCLPVSEDLLRWVTSQELFNIMYVNL